MRKALIYLFVGFILLVAILGFQFFKFHDGKLHIVACDVGQGDAFFIRTPKGSDILIDGGPNDKVLSCLSSHMPFWDRTLELVILTHPDTDHSAGLIDVIERYRVIHLFTQKVPGKTKVFQKLERVLAENSTTAKHLYQDDFIREGDFVSLRVLWPSKEMIKITEQNISNHNLKLNELSVVLELRYENFKALFTGDAGSEVMDQIAGDAGDIDLLKVPHHGSKTGMSESFLMTVKPELAIISAGNGNKYGHPTQFILDLLSNIGAKILRTDLEGEIEVVSDGEKYWIK